MTNTQTTTKKKLLWIEDDALLGSILGKELAATGMELIHAQNGEEAMTLLRGTVPDAVMVDLVLPGKLDGFGILTEMSSDPRLKDVPRIVLSNLSKPSDIARAKELGAQRFMVKAESSLASIVSEVKSLVS